MVCVELPAIFSDITVLFKCLLHLEKGAASEGSCSRHLIRIPVSLNSHLCYAKWKTINFRINSRDNVFLPTATSNCHDPVSVEVTECLLW